MLDKIKFVESNLFETIDNNSKFDIIASNPPYIADGVYDGLPPEVKADPKVSLLAGKRGLDVIERLISEAPDYLTRPGYLIFEIGYDQGEALFDMVDRDDRYVDTSLFKDLNDIDRVFFCKV